MARRGQRSHDQPDAGLEIGAVLNRLHAAAARWGRGEVSLAALSTLATLLRTGPRRISDLAVAEGVTQPTMTAMVKSLARAGLIERRPDPDNRRATLVSLNDAGEALLHDRRHSGAEAFARLIDQLSPDQRAALQAALPALHQLQTLDEQQQDSSDPRAGQGPR